MKYRRSRKHKGVCKHRHQSQRQEDAEQSSGGSQEEHPIRTRVLRILRFQSGEKLSIKNNFFDQGETVMNSESTVSGNDVHYYSEAARKLSSWMRETRFKIFMLIELEKCRNELG